MTVQRNRTYSGAVEKDGHMVCARCGRWDNTVTYSRSSRGRTYEERECVCGNRIVMIEKEDAQCSKN